MELMKKLLKEFIEIVVITIFLSIPLVILLTMWAVVEPAGHYEGTETIQPDGTYYIWVEE